MKQLKTLLALVALTLLGATGAWAQSNYQSTYTSNVGVGRQSQGNSCYVTIQNTTYSGIESQKISGITNKRMRFPVPGGTKTLTIHAFGLEANNIQLQVSTDGGSTFQDVSGYLAYSASGVSKLGSTYTITASALVHSCYKEISFDSPLLKNTDVILQAKQADQTFVAFGVNAVMENLFLFHKGEYEQFTYDFTQQVYTVTQTMDKDHETFGTGAFWLELGGTSDDHTDATVLVCGNENNTVNWKNHTSLPVVVGGTPDAGGNFSIGASGDFTFSLKFNNAGMAMDVNGEWPVPTVWFACDGNQGAALQYDATSGTYSGEYTVEAGKPVWFISEEGAVMAEQQLTVGQNNCNNIPMSLASSGGNFFYMAADGTYIFTLKPNGDGYLLSVTPKSGMWLQYFIFNYASQEWANWHGSYTQAFSSNGDGTYSIEVIAPYHVVEAGKASFFIRDGINPDTAYGTPNATGELTRTNCTDIAAVTGAGVNFEIGEAGTCTITFNPTAGTLSLVWAEPEYRIESDNGDFIQQFNGNLAFTKFAADGTYRKQVTVTQELIDAGNASISIEEIMSQAYYGAPSVDEAYINSSHCINLDTPVSNYRYNIQEPGTLTLIFNPETEKLTVKGFKGASVYRLSVNDSAPDETFVYDENSDSYSLQRTVQAGAKVYVVNENFTAYTLPEYAEVVVDETNASSILFKLNGEGGGGGFLRMSETGNYTFVVKETSEGILLTIEGWPEYWFQGNNAEINQMVNFEMKMTKNADGTYSKVVPITQQLIDDGNANFAIQDFNTKMFYVAASDGVTISRSNCTDLPLVEYGTNSPCFSFAEPGEWTVIFSPANNTLSAQWARLIPQYYLKYWENGDEVLEPFTENDGVYTLEHEITQAKLDEYQDFGFCLIREVAGQRTPYLAESSNQNLDRFNCRNIRLYPEGGEHMVSLLYIREANTFTFKVLDAEGTTIPELTVLGWNAPTYKLAYKPTADSELMYADLTYNQETGNYSVNGLEMFEGASFYLCSGDHTQFWGASAENIVLDRNNSENVQMVAGETPIKMSTHGTFNITMYEQDANLGVTVTNWPGIFLLGSFTTKDYGTYTIPWQLTDEYEFQPKEGAPGVYRLNNAVISDVQWGTSEFIIYWLKEDGMHYEYAGTVQDYMLTQDSNNAIYRALEAFTEGNSNNYKLLQMPQGTYTFELNTNEEVPTLTVVDWLPQPQPPFYLSIDPYTPFTDNGDGTYTLTKEITDADFGQSSYVIFTLIDDDNNGYGCGQSASIFSDTNTTLPMVVCVEGGESWVFEVTQPGEYTFTVNAADPTSMTLTATMQPIRQKYYLVGDMNSWSLDNMVRLNFNEESGLYEYIYTTENTNTYFVVSDVASADSWESFADGHRYCAAEATDEVNAELTLNVSKQLVPSTGGAFHFSGAGTFKITLTEDLKLTVRRASEIEPTDVSQIANVIYPVEKEACAGGQAVLSFNMKNEALIRGFEFDLYLPSGVEAVESDGDIEATLNTDRMPSNNSHSLSVSKNSNGSLHFLCSAFDNKNYATGDSEVLTLRIKVSENMAVGEYPVEMKSVRLSKTNINQYFETESVISKLIVGSFLLGDVNGDGIVNLTDYIWTANYIHENASPDYIFKAGDVNGDGFINLLDYIGIANIIHTGSPYGEEAGAKAAVFEETEETLGLDPQ